MARRTRVFTEWSYYVFAATALLTVSFLIGIFFFLAWIGLQALFQIPLSEFLFGTHWNPNSFGEPSWGTASLLLGTLIVSLVSLALSVPLGIAVAIYLAEVASPKVRETLKPFVEMIASIPTVVLGLLGLLFLAPFIAKIFGLSNALNALTASILVAVVALPTIASICEDALSSVSKRHRDASYALGASKWTTIRRVVVPAARSGLIAGILLGLGRIIGETMIVLMVAGNSIKLPQSLLDPVRPITANIAIEVKEVVVGSLHWEALFAIGLLLFLITFLINVVADFFIHREARV
jgi:phosphate transport system permease protein